MRMVLTGVAAEVARQIPVAALIEDKGHVALLNALRTAFGGSDGQRGHAAYRRLRGLYRGDRSMEVYLADVAVALADCRAHGYSLEGTLAAALVLRQAGLDASKQASTVALAASLRDEAGSEERAVSTALRDLWGGVSVLQAAPGAVMMVVTCAEHQELAARQTTPRPRPRRLPRNPKGD